MPSTAARASASFAAALAIAGLITAVDTVTMASLELLDLLVLAPLVAAIGSDVRRTAGVGALVTVLALVLGLVDEEFGGTDHVIAVATVALGSALASWVAHLRTTRERDSARLSIQYAVAQTLAEADSLESVAPRLLEQIGTPLGWEIGELWNQEGDGRLRLAASWSAPGRDAPEFDALSRSLTLPPGVGLPGRAVEVGAPVWAEDFAREPDLPRADAARRAGLRGGVAFPLYAGDETIGAIDFFTRELRAADANLSHFLTTVAIQIGELAEAMRADEARRSSEVRKSAIFSSALEAIISIDHHGHVLEFNPAAERKFGWRADEALGRELAQLVVPPALRERHRAALRRAVETGEMQLQGRHLELTATRRDGSEFPVELTITRIAGEDPPVYTGFVRDITDRVRADRERERLLLLEQAARVGAVQARDQLEAILRGVADGVTAQAPDGSLVFANEAAARTIGFESIEELLRAPLAEVMGRFEVFDERGRPFPLERLPGRIALTEGVAAEAMVRFRVRATGEEHWSMVKASPVRDDGGAVAMAINVFEDVSETKRSEMEQHFLAEASRVLGSSLDPGQVLRQVAELAVPDIADWCIVDLRQPGGAVARAAIAHVDPAAIERAERMIAKYPPDPDADRGVPRVLATGESELYPDIRDELLVAGAVDQEQLDLLREFGVRSAMIVPMVARGRTVGALTFVSGPSARRFGDRDLQLAEELGRRCAIAIDNARLYSEHARIARTLQQSLLPAELPRIPGLDTAARFRAAGAGTEVGGDFYDLFETGARGWTVVVGDVCGKGPDAAAITALARYTLRSAAMRHKLPSRSLSELNQALLRQRLDRRFCTVACAYLEAHNGGMRIGFASGGHPLPLLLAGNGEVRPFGDHGTLLGVVPDPSLEDRAHLLEPGDSLVFYTDGVTEAGGQVVLGEDRLAELIASCAGLDAEGIASRIEAEVLEFQGGEPRDDIAVVVLQVVAQEAE